MSYEPSALSGHHVGEINRAHTATGNSFNPSTIVNGGHGLRPGEGERKRNYKLLIDPVLKGRGHQKIYRFDGDFEGQAPVIPKDPRSRRIRLWSTRTKADLPIPKFKIDKFYVGIPPQRDIILNGLNDNVDRKFLCDICEKFGNIEGIKIFYDPLTKRHLGKARVGFSTSASAKLAVAKLDGTSIMGCIVHADFEHKVEIKPSTKPQTSQHGAESAHKTPPSIERITGHHVLPTPPPSASSQSPANSTPSTPGSLGLIDPRTRGYSTSSVSTETYRSSSPSPWPPHTTQQPAQNSHKAPVFEPISPPCERATLPPPPPPDAPPPPLPGKSSPPMSSSGKTKQQSLGDKYQDTSTQSGRDPKGSNKNSRDSYKSSHQSDNSEWRRRDRGTSRDRYDRGSYRSRWSSDGRGSYSSYQDKESRYSSYKDYSSRGRSGGEGRDSFGRSESRRSSSYRDSDGRRSRDSDGSCSSEKSESSRKSKYDHPKSDNIDSENSKKTNYGGKEKEKESIVKSSASVDQKSEGNLRLNSSLSRDSSNKVQGGVLSSSHAAVNLTSNLDSSVVGMEITDKIQKEPFSSWNDCSTDTVNTRTKEDGRSDILNENVPAIVQVAGNSVSSERNLDKQERPEATLETLIQKEVNTTGATTPVIENTSDLLLSETDTKPVPENLQNENTGSYFPVYEDISPVSSPTKAKAPSPCTFPVTHPVTDDSHVESCEEMLVDKDNQGKTEDNDDAMSLSSISSNEETFEVTEPKRVPITVPPPTIPFPPPFVPSVPPPPFIPPFDPTVPPPSITPISILPPIPITVPPPTIAVPPPPIQTLTHPLVPPSFHPAFPPQFVTTLTGVPPLPVQPQYQLYPSGHVPSSHDQQRPAQKKTWKAKISDEVLRIVSKELELILKRDVTKRLVENSAFKALDGWWDNLGKTKFNTATQQDPVPTTQPSMLSSTTQSDMTSSPFFSTSMNQSGGIGVGLRASLPKMPSFRKRQQPTTSGSELYAKRRREDSGSEPETKSSHVGSDSEVSGRRYFTDSSHSKRVRIDDQLSSEDNCASPWQPTEDGMDGPPATSVRTEEKHPTVGSSLYTNIYSSLSESESSLSAEESDSDNSRDDRSDWDESESDMSSESASEYSSDEDEEIKRSVKTSGMTTGIPRTPPGTPPETPPETPPPIPRTPSTSPPASPIDSQLPTIQEFPEPEEAEVVHDREPEDKVGLLGLSEVTQDNFRTIDSSDYTSEELKTTDKQEVLVSVSAEDKDRVRKNEILPETLRKDVEEHLRINQQPTSEDSTQLTEQDFSTTSSATQELKSTSELKSSLESPSELESQQELNPPLELKSPPVLKLSPALPEQFPEDHEVDVTNGTTPEEFYKPVVELPPEFPLRPYWQDDQLVYDFLVSGLDYEDACYLKTGFESLVQVGSDSIANGHWSFHPTTYAGVPTKGRKQKSDNFGVRIHSSGCARCEGYYKIGMNEKAKYLEAAKRQVDRTQMVDNKISEEKEANKAKQQSRENRALQRRLAASFQNEDFGDILKFNQLKVRKKKLTFCKSPIHDWGLFALEPIGPDEMVIEYVGEVVRQAIADDREKRYERLGIGSSYLFRVDSDTILDATKFGNLARFINHCCEPNCYAKVVTLESEKKIVIYSKRDIAVNEEITYDYKFPIEDDKIPCLCGAAQCRGTLN